MADTPSTSFQALMSLSSLDDQRDYLRSVDQLNEDGLIALLEGAAANTTSDIDTAAQLATIVVALAPETNAHSLIPRAHYLLGQTEMMRGQHEAALALVDLAHDHYVAQNDQVGAWRTTVGRVHILGSSGKYDEALATGQRAFEQITQTTPIPPPAQQIASLIAINQGVCSHEIGQYQRALQWYDEAQKFAEQITPLQKEYLQINREIVLTLLGQYDQALQSAQLAINSWESDQPIPKVKRLLNLGFLHLQTGNYLDSLAVLAEAQTVSETISDTVDAYLVWLNSAHTWLMLNLHTEALTAYRRAQVGLETAAIPHDLARAWRGIGAVLSATDQYSEAEDALNRAADLFATIDNAPHQAAVLIELAGLFLKQDRPDDAYRVGGQAAELAYRFPVPTVQFFAELRLVDLMLMTGDTSSATIRLQAAGSAIAELQLPHLLWLLRHREGLLAQATGDDVTAEQQFRAAITAIEQLRGTLPQEALRTSFLQDKTAVYADLLNLYLAQDKFTQAFAIAEQAKARTLVDLMVGAVDDQLTSALSDGDTDQLRALKNDLNALYNQLLSDNDETRGTRQLIQSRAVELEQSIQQFRLKTAASHAQLFQSALPFATLRHQLPPDLPIVAYHIINGDILAFVYNGRGEQAVRVVRSLGTEQAAVALLNKLTQRWNRLRLVHDLITPDELIRHERSAQRVLQALHEMLFAPLRPFLPHPNLSNSSKTDVQPVVIVPHGILHALPFHALHNGEQYVIDLYDVSYAPSVAVFALCQQQPTHTTEIKNAHIIGVDDPSITHVAAEITAIAPHFTHSEIYAETKANRHAFDQIDPAADLLHVASHGLFRADNPMFSALKLADGWLTAYDIMQLPYVPPLVTLSACESGRGNVTVGDELLGLTRAFIGRGATTLIATLWLVQDEVAADLMPIFYQKIKTLPTKTAALRSAQLAIRDAYPHPWYWATFQLIGKR